MFVLGEGLRTFRVYLGYKSTFMRVGGYQVRISPSRFLKHPFHWVDYVLPGPHDDEKYISRAVPADLTQRTGVSAPPATDSKSVSNCRARRIRLNGRGRAAGRVGQIRVIS
ncbi:hypothetical protein B0H34DRAFT_725866 [Crassisporium funariophilum]|nr:hypothetical protein B0H34DRAFT_725866 [Crassisporium funariophilum]